MAPVLAPFVPHITINSTFDTKDIELLQNIAKLFTYYLELENLAYRDALTNLHNLQFLFTQAERIKTSNGLFVLFDLDNFKQVNDDFGHAVGDLVLKEVGRKLLTLTVKYPDSFAVRIGGDEFVFYAEGDFSASEQLGLINHLKTALRTWKTNIGTIKLSASGGAIKITKHNKQTLDDIIQAADTLLYEVKRAYKNEFLLRGLEA